MSENYISKALPEHSVLLWTKRGLVVAQSRVFRAPNEIEDCMTTIR